RQHLLRQVLQPAVPVIPQDDAIETQDLSGALQFLGPDVPELFRRANPRRLSRFSPGGAVEDDAGVLPVGVPGDRSAAGEGFVIGMGEDEQCGSGHGRPPLQSGKKWDDFRSLLIILHYHRAVFFFSKLVYTW